MSARLLHSLPRRLVIAVVVLFAVLVLRHQAAAPTPVSSECMPPPGRALGSAGRIAAHHDQRASVTLTKPIGLHIDQGAWLIAAADRGRVRVFRAEDGGFIWSAIELHPRSADARPVLRCVQTAREAGR
jgi:hypothetical protein